MPRRLWSSSASARWRADLPISSRRDSGARESASLCLHWRYLTHDAVRAETKHAILAAADDVRLVALHLDVARSSTGASEEVRTVLRDPERRA